MAVERMDKKDLERVKAVQSKYHNLTYRMGELALQEREADVVLNQIRKNKDDVVGQIKDVEEEYQRLSQEMNKKYGDVIFNLDTGEAVKEENQTAETTQ